jgi:hypothetical protein
VELVPPELPATVSSLADPAAAAAVLTTAALAALVALAVLPAEAAAAAVVDYPTAAQGESEAAARSESGFGSNLCPS